jgi:photosystem II stability/assembly factor-like uncharacterized protein
MKYCLILFVTVISISNVRSQWVQINSGTNTNITSITFTNSMVGYFATKGQDSSGAIFKTNNLGSNWQSILATQSPLYSICFPDLNNGFVAGPKDIQLTSNGGVTWLDRFMPDFDYFDIRLQNSFTIYAVGRERNSPLNTAMIRSTNGGIIWNSVFTFGRTDRLFSIRFPNEITGYCCGESGRMLKVIEGVTSWTDKITGTHQNLNHLYFFNTSTGFAAGDSATLIKTTTAGNTWFNVQTGFSNINFKSIEFFNDSIGYIVGSNGFIAKTTNGGLNWIAQSTNVSNNLNSIVFVNLDTLFASGDNGTLLRTFNGGINGLETIGGVVPRIINLFQNYPNPFNPTTKIKFDIPTPLNPPEGGKLGANVTLRIYDILGREAATLVNEQLKPGSYEVEWNASKFSSGIYFYTLITGEFTQTKKLILIK